MPLGRVLMLLPDMHVCALLAADRAPLLQWHSNRTFAVSWNRSIAVQADVCSSVHKTHLEHLHSS